MCVTMGQGHLTYTSRVTSHSLFVTDAHQKTVAAKLLKQKQKIQAVQLTKLFF
jgi:hypothetical protein